MKRYQQILAKHLGNKLHYYKEIDSTNSVAKNLKDWEHGTVIVAETQTAGRGTYGRTFHSAAERGIYLTLILNETTWHFQETGLTTIYTAIAVAEAVAEVAGIELELKWVNDLFVNRRKVGGILTETDFQTHKLVIGIGINLIGNPTDFPTDIQDTATSLGLLAPIDEQAAKIVLTIYQKIMHAKNFATSSLLASYKRRLFILGETVEIISNNEIFEAEVLDVAVDGKLVVKRDKEVLCLGFGEVRIKI